VIFFQAAVPSRSHVPEYRRLAEDVEQAVQAINWKYGRDGWQPVIYVREHLDLSLLLALYRKARFMMVSALHDGMNLVAKEFVAAQVDGNGVLILSKFTGAARELKDAIIINPYEAEGTADRIRDAIEMDPLEVRRRMGRLRERVRENNIYKWASDIIQKLARVA